MAIDKVIDGLQLDNDLTNIANAIRLKANSSEKLSFPNDFINIINSIPVSENIDVPKFVGTYDFDEGLINISCNKTFEECKEYINLQKNGGLLELIDSDNNSEFIGLNIRTVDEEELIYTTFINGWALNIIYTPDTLTATNQQFPLLEYEEGEITVSSKEDIFAYFQNEHFTPPIFFCIASTESTSFNLMPYGDIAIIGGNFSNIFDIPAFEASENSPYSIDGLITYLQKDNSSSTQLQSVYTTREGATNWDSYVTNTYLRISFSGRPMSGHFRWFAIWNTWKLPK